MFFHTGLAAVAIVLCADGSVETDAELAIARLVFAREFPEDATRVQPVQIVEAIES